MQPAWPAVVHSNQQWLNGYDAGWRQLETMLVEGFDLKLPRRALWLLYCARHAWSSWPLDALLEQVQRSIDRVEGPLDGLEAQSIWLEWQLYQLTGHGHRVQACFKRFAARAGNAGYQPAAEPLWCTLASRTLAEMSQLLDRPINLPVPDDAAGELGENDADYDRALAALWSLPTGASAPEAAAQLVGTVTHRLAQATRRDTESTRAWVERGLLLATLLRQMQEPELVWEVASAALDGCLSYPQLWIYLPPLLLDHGIGLEADAAHHYLAWWLYATLSIGVERLVIGSNELSLQAQPEQGAGVRILIRCNQKLALEIHTRERSYVEQIPPGEHQMLLTVLDRTDVR